MYQLSKLTNLVNLQTYQLINLIMIHLFTIIFYQPLLNLLIFLYNVVPGQDVGVSIILVTVIIRLILYPFSAKAIKAQKLLQEMQPKIEEMKKLYKDQKEKQAQEMMKIYKEHKINPFSSCLPLLIQFPFLIAVYQVFNTGLSNGSLDLLYPFIANPGHINTIAFGFLDLGKANILLAIAAGAAQFWQAKMMLAKRPSIKNKDSKDEDMAAIMSKQMVYMMPVMTVVIGAGLPSGLVLYWLVITVITALQQILVLKFSKSGKKPEPPAIAPPVQPVIEIKPVE